MPPYKNWISINYTADSREVAAFVTGRAKQTLIDRQLLANLAVELGDEPMELAKDLSYRLRRWRSEHDLEWGTTYRLRLANCPTPVYASIFQGDLYVWED